VNAVLKETPARRDGASIDEWAHFDLVLGLSSYLLPIVHDAAARPTPASEVKQFGKIPSEYTANGARGIKGWQSRDITPADLERWSRDRRLSLGIRASAVRAIDVDIDDAARAAEVAAVIAQHAALPKRTRSNSAKFLQAFDLRGRHKKRRIVTSRGAIEFLADGQQFVAAGRHPSGVRYEWEGGLPSDIPVLTSEQFEALWADLEERFGTRPRGTPPAQEARGDSGDLLAEISDAQLQDLRSALAHPQLRRDAGEEPVCSEVGLALLSLGDVGRELWLAFCAAADDNSDEPDPSWPDTWWEQHASVVPRSNFTRIYKMAADRGWRNPIASRVSSVDEFPVLGEAHTESNPIDSYYAYLPQHQYIERKTRQLFPTASVDGNLRGWNVDRLKPSAWLDKNRAVHQMTWDPNRGELIEGEIVAEGGWVASPGKSVYNLYRPAPQLTGVAAQARPWLDHLARVYPAESDHLLRWFAHRVQRPGEKINHAIVLGGAQGIGKDTLLEPLKAAVGRWNWQEISPAQMLGRFNGWVKAVVVRVSEARDLGDVDRFAFYDHSKTYMAAPPEVMRVDEKHVREYAVLNVMGVVITTNHRTDGIYLPTDDRRHFVAWSPLTKTDFDEHYWRKLWGWYEGGGVGHVAALLREFDLTGFDAKEPPPRTEAFHAIVQANVAPEDSELGSLVERLGNPAIVTVDELRAAVGPDDDDSGLWGIFERSARRALPHRLERAGYVNVANPNATDGLWKIHGKRQALYGRRELSVAERFAAAAAKTARRVAR
jgi:hypothetical protein